MLTSDCPEILPIKLLISINQSKDSPFLLYPHWGIHLGKGSLKYEDNCLICSFFSSFIEYLYFISFNSALYFENMVFVFPESNFVKIVPSIFFSDTM